MISTGYRNITFRASGQESRGEGWKKTGPMINFYKNASADGRMPVGPIHHKPD